MSTVFTGISGTAYQYERILEDQISFALYPVPGHFVFARITPRGIVVVYVGETQTLKDALQDLGKRAAAINTHKCNAIFWHRSSGDAIEQHREQEDLIEAYLPPMNDYPEALSDKAMLRYAGSLPART